VSGLLPDGRVALAAILAGVAAAAAAGLIVRPAPRLASRVRPYTLIPRSRLGRTADIPNLAGEEAWLSGARSGGSSARRCWRSRAGLGGLLDARSEEGLRLMLRQAGYRDLSPEEYRVRQLGAAALGAAAGVTAGLVLAGSAALVLVLGVLGFVIGSTRWRAASTRAPPCGGSGCGSSSTRSISSSPCTSRREAARSRQPSGSSPGVGGGGGGAGGGVADDRRWHIPAGGVRPGGRTHRRAPGRAHLRAAGIGDRAWRRRRAALLAFSEDIRDDRREDLKKAATRRRAAMLVPIIALLAPVMLLFILAPIPRIVFGLH